MEHARLTVDMDKPWNTWITTTEIHETLLKKGVMWLMIFSLIMKDLPWCGSSD